MQTIIENGWYWFTISFGLLLLATLIMNTLSNNFYTHDVVERRFSIMDLEFAANGNEIRHLIHGMYLLEPEKSRKALRSLNWHLLVDFIFMPAVYGSIFLLCMKVSNKMTSDAGQEFFLFLAWAQILPWAIDIIENAYILSKIKASATASSLGVHKLYQFMELTKWSLALLAGMCALFALLYFWLTGNYSTDSLRFAVIIIGEIVLFFIAGSVAAKMQKKD